MLDIKFIRQNPDKVKEAIKNKGLVGTVDIDQLLKIDKNLVEIRSKLESIRQKRNDLNRKIKVEKDEEKKLEIIQENAKLKPESLKLEKEYKGLEEEYNRLMKLVPNLTSPKMPIGRDENDNKVVRTWGSPRNFSFKPLDHVDLGKKLDLIDVSKSGEISGPRTYYLKNEAVLMQFAILNFVFKTLTNKKIISDLAKKTNNPFNNTFSPVLPPVFIKPEVMEKMDRLHPIEERYELKKDGLVLVGSAEHTLGSYHMDETFELKDLPVRYIGYSSAFRREAGSYGKDVRGILRVHHFDKAEMETFVPAEYGEVEQEFIVAIQEYLVQQLEIPYQVIQICTGDTGKPDYNQYDINCWLPGQNKFRETHTSDYMTDYQARRLNIRYRDKDGKTRFVHMNDATAFAMGRILIAILENYQQEDGSVIVPDILREYVGVDVIKPKE